MRWLYRGLEGNHLSDNSNLHLFPAESGATQMYVTGIFYLYARSYRGQSAITLFL